MGEKAYLINKVEFFTAELQEGDIDHYILNIKKKVNQWLIEHEEAEINKCICQCRVNIRYSGYGIRTQIWLILLPSVSHHQSLLCKGQ
jgi:hypothetical protein